MVSISKPKTLVLLAPGALPSSDVLIPLNILRVRKESTYLTFQDSQHDAIRHHFNVEQAVIISVASFLAQADRGSYDLLFIPGTADVLGLDLEPLANVIRSIYGGGVGLDIISTGTARLLLAASGLLKERVVSAASLDLNEQYMTTARAWDADADVIRDVQFWTATDTPGSLKTLAILYKAARHGGISSIFPSSVARKHLGYSPRRLVDTPTDTSTPAALASGEDLAAELADLSSSDVDQASNLIFHFAIRLGLEGFTDACNSVLLTLLKALPNALESLGEPCMRSIEYMWESSGQRPSVPWNVPSLEDLDRWELEVRSSYQLPADEDREDILESIKLRITIDGDWYLTPYTLAGAITMALDAGWDDQAREWMLKLVQTASKSDMRDVWTFDIARWRPLIRLSRTGIVAQVTGRTFEQANHDAEVVRQALQSLRTSSVVALDEQRVSSQSIADLPWSTLVPMLDVLKWEQHDTLIKPPASPSAIKQAEERLGVALPEDYKQFLLVSNGIEFMPSIDAPGFQSVQELEWDNAAELGLDEFRVDLGCKTDPAEYDRLPKMGRVLVVSDPECEEQVWFVDPETVAEAIRVLRAEGRSDGVVGQPGWRAVFWASHMPDLRWLKSFRGYMEGLAQKADKAGGR
ncbi:uncharacterized protein C8Q71DRAFT_754851 [Rhodofomes roseus]|uniref:Knr4/Smi1-like domain-containing protein n=1 Tax=Rhodofomes roseus TaxID=34475 RepID=A0ABQ8KIQ6_9APHY|nr:uncharacterized protein C8Q71DRAFT_754851 [Rhodofomes roseus]KAH9837853.1 hypothetical protein C8Q71DRAFT_754851 [Rhodofomes roseus]